MSGSTRYRVTDVQPLQPTGKEGTVVPRRFLGQVLSAQDLVNAGACFEGKGRASILHQGRSWVLTLEDAGGDEPWNAVPHGRDEGEYSTEVQVDGRSKRLFIP